MKSIFLIDDDSDDREIFQSALDVIKVPYAYAEASDGEDALNKIKNDAFVKPDIIFLDLNMPKIDGRQFLKTIKQIDGYKDIPVIIYSTSSIDVDKKYAFENGAADFITKHSSFNELCSELKTRLELNV